MQFDYFSQAATLFSYFKTKKKMQTYPELKKYLVQSCIKNDLSDSK